MKSIDYAHVKVQTVIDEINELIIIIHLNIACTSIFPLNNFDENIFFDVRP